MSFVGRKVDGIDGDADRRLPRLGVGIGEGADGEARSVEAEVEGGDREPDVTGKGEDVVSLRREVLRVVELDRRYPGHGSNRPDRVGNGTRLPSRRRKEFRRVAKRYPDMNSTYAPFFSAADLLTPIPSWLHTKMSPRRPSDTASGRR